MSKESQPTVPPHDENVFATGAAWRHRQTGEYILVQKTRLLDGILRIDFRKAAGDGVSTGVQQTQFVSEYEPAPPAEGRLGKCLFWRRKGDGRIFRIMSVDVDSTGVTISYSRLDGTEAGWVDMDVFLSHYEKATEQQARETIDEHLRGQICTNRLARVDKDGRPVAGSLWFLDDDPSTVVQAGNIDKGVININRRDGSPIDAIRVEDFLAHFSPAASPGHFYVVPGSDSEKTPMRGPEEKFGPTIINTAALSPDARPEPLPGSVWRRSHVPSVDATLVTIYFVDPAEQADRKVVYDYGFGLENLCRMGLQAFMDAFEEACPYDSLWVRKEDGGAFQGKTAKVELVGDHPNGTMWVVFWYLEAAKYDKMPIKEFLAAFDRVERPQDAPAIPPAKKSSRWRRRKDKQVIPVQFSDSLLSVEALPCEATSTGRYGLWEFLDNHEPADVEAVKVMRTILSKFEPASPGLGVWTEWKSKKDELRVVINGGYKNGNVIYYQRIASDGLLTDGGDTAGRAWFLSYYQPAEEKKP